MNEKEYDEKNDQDYEKLKLSLSEALNINIGVRSGRLKKSSIKMTIKELIEMKEQGVYFLQDSFDMDHYLSHFGSNKDVLIRVVEFK